jgi:proteasome accessory factor B
MSNTPRSRPPLARLLFIHNRLLAGMSVNATTLKDAFGVRRWTVLRDVTFMRDSWDLPIEFDERRNSYVYNGRVANLPRGQVTEGELLTALVVRQAIETYRGTSWYPQLASSLEKLTSGMRDTISFEPSAEAAAISLKSRGISQPDMKVFKILSQGVVRQRELVFFYRKPGERLIESRRVQAYHLSHRDNLWYLIGYDRGRGALRTFAVPRISKPRLLRQTFQRPEAFSSDEHFASALNVLSGRGSYRIVIRFTGATADRVAERDWHETQELRRLRDGRTELTLVLGALGEIEQWVLGWGAEAEIIEPVELRERVHQSARAIVQKYQRRGAA